MNEKVERPKPVAQVLYELWDKNVEVPNETDHVQYNKGYMHALADVKSEVIGGDSFPGNLKERYGDGNK